METRIFHAPVTVFSIDGSRLESFNSGERAKNIHRIGTRVIFEPVPFVALGLPQHDVSANKRRWRFNQQ